MLQKGSEQLNKISFKIPLKCFKIQQKIPEIHVFSHWNANWIKGGMEKSSHYKTSIKSMLLFFDKNLHGNKLVFFMKHCICFNLNLNLDFHLFKLRIFFVFEFMPEFFANFIKEKSNIFLPGISHYFLHRIFCFQPS